MVPSAGRWDLEIVGNDENLGGPMDVIHFLPQLPSPCTGGQEGEDLRPVDGDRL